MLTNIDFIDKLRIEKSGLYNQFNTIEECLYALVGMQQAQYNQHAIINIFNRVKDFQISNLAMYASSNKIIKVWEQRLTLHIFNIRLKFYKSCIFSQR